MLVAKTLEKKIRIGDWCVFQCEPDSSHANKRKTKRVMIGHVMPFSALSAASKKEMNATILEWDGEENVGALCHCKRFLLRTPNPSVVNPSTANILPEEEGGNLQFALPLTEIEAIRPFEERLQSVNNYKQLVGLIRGLGGSCLADAIKRAYSLVFSFQGRSACNWGGKIRNGVKKLGIAKSPVTRAVFEGIKGVPQFTGVKLSELELETKHYLKRAPEQVRLQQTRREEAVTSRQTTTRTATDFDQRGENRVCKRNAWVALSSRQKMVVMKSLTDKLVISLVEQSGKEKISPEEIIVGSWGLVDAHRVTGDPTQVDMDVIVILSREHLYMV
ncbi:Uncharacterized protein APZ42_025650 [Daphnia magna]|uniref:DUF4806 domain-containing protein n=1 Tax=Daphnia magna TaxID=35525 RepID=A0A164SW90_9CRUS|nr:Uncharacterized protein APZ42_025650 [Daphnia magna]